MHGLSPVQTVSSTPRSQAAGSHQLRRSVTQTEPSMALTLSSTDSSKLSDYNQLLSFPEQTYSLKFPSQSQEATKGKEEERKRPQEGWEEEVAQLRPTFHPDFMGLDLWGLWRGPLSGPQVRPITHHRWHQLPGAWLRNEPKGFRHLGSNSQGPGEGGIWPPQATRWPPTFNNLPPFLSPSKRPSPQTSQSTGVRPELQSHILAPRP